MPTLSLLDFTDLAIIAAFVSAVLAFVVYLWRSGHRPHHRDLH